MDTYQAIFHYFRKMDNTLKYSADQEEALIGIRSTATWLQSALSSEKSTKISYSFMLDGVMIYYHHGYMVNFSNSKSRAYTAPWQSSIPVQIDAATIKVKTLIPYEVYVTINDIECTYSIVDFILLEGFYDECPKANVGSNSQESQKIK